MHTYWSKITADTNLYLSEKRNTVLGRLLATYNVQVLEVCSDLVRIFSPDLNQTGYVEKENIILI